MGIFGKINGLMQERAERDEHFELNGRKKYYAWAGVKGALSDIGNLE